MKMAAIVFRSVVQCG